MNQPQKLEAIITHLRGAEAKMKEDDHIGFAMLCLLIFFALLYFIAGHSLIFAALCSCLGLAILFYYWIRALRERSSWYWGPVRREVQGKSLEQMWKTSDRGDWLLWFSAHMIGKPGWPTHQQVVLASCQCARSALKYIDRGETRPLKAIETTEAWARGEAILDEVRNAGRAADYPDHDSTAYCAAQAAHAAALAVYATEDGACFRLAQAASDAASRAASAVGYEIFEKQLGAGDFTSTARAVRDRAEKATLRECADLVRRTLTVPNALTNELPIYDWVRRWHRNSSGQRTGRMNHIPIAISRHSPEVELNENGLNPTLRIATIVTVLATGWLLIGALGRNPAYYYSMLRWLTCSTAALLVWRGDAQGSLKWGYVLVPVAVLFNPVIPVHFKGNRMDTLGSWHTVDTVAAVALFLVLALMEIRLWQTKKRHNYSKTHSATLFTTTETRNQTMQRTAPRSDA